MDHSGAWLSIGASGHTKPLPSIIHNLLRFHSPWDPLFQHHKFTYILFSCFLPIVLWFIWRLWMFTIYPMLYSEEPRQLPYTCPYLGQTRPSSLNSVQSS